jgi:hypothetical protein
MDASVEAFLETAKADLQRQLATSARLEAMTADVLETGMTIRAKVAVAGERIILSGSGASLIEAYSALIEAAPHAVLLSAHRQVLDS